MPSLPYSVIYHVLITRREIMHGITLTERPADWEILQQTDNSA